MRNVPNVKANRCRIRTGERGSGDEAGNNGAFMIHQGGLVSDLGVIVSEGEGWDHVSVSTRTRVPTWEEMCFVKELFFQDDEVVMQLHPAKKDWINDHPYTLHLWRPQTVAEQEAIKQRWRESGEKAPWEIEERGQIPLPPKWMVGPGIAEGV